MIELNGTKHNINNADDIENLKTFDRWMLSSSTSYSVVVDKNKKICSGIVTLLMRQDITITDDKIDYTDKFIDDIHQYVKNSISSESKVTYNKDSRKVVNPNNAFKWIVTNIIKNDKPITYAIASDILSGKTFKWYSIELKIE